MEIFLYHVKVKDGRIEKMEILENGTENMLREA
jgi:uncharacterized protein with FMN-binding domain